MKEGNCTKDKPEQKDDGSEFVTLRVFVCVCVFSLQSGLTALHLAAQEDKVAVAEILAKNGANLDQQTKV